jgi:hypothetical protein
VSKSDNYTPTGKRNPDGGLRKLLIFATNFEFLLPAFERSWCSFSFQNPNAPNKPQWMFKESVIVVRHGDRIEGLFVYVFFEKNDNIPWIKFLIQRGRFKYKQACMHTIDTPLV